MTVSVSELLIYARNTPGAGMGENGYKRMGLLPVGVSSLGSRSLLSSTWTAWRYTGLLWMVPLRDHEDDFGLQMTLG